jgi:hypothetical protein
MAKAPAAAAAGNPSDAASNIRRLTLDAVFMLRA